MGKVKKEMNGVEYANHRNISRAAVSKLIKEDRVLLTEDGRIDVEISDMLLDASPKTKKSSKSTSLKKKDKGKLTPEEKRLQAALEYPEARAKLTKYKAEMAKLELEEEQGKLIRVTNVQHQAFECARVTRDKILGVVDRVSGLLAAELDEIKIRNILDKELREALAALGNGDIK